MTVYVDDSGWGSLLGGVAIGMYNDKGLFKYRMIPVKYFQGKEYKKQTYLKIALNHFLEMEPQMGSYKDLKICRGFILDSIWDFCEEFSRYSISREEIGDPLQGKLEDAYASYLESLGVPRKSNGAHCLSYDEQVKWATKFKKRTKLVKTGWPAWQRLKK